MDVQPWGVEARSEMPLWGNMVLALGHYLMPQKEMQF